MPSGNTSFRRTATSAAGSSEVSSKSSRGAPSISKSLSSGDESKHKERPSSGRWSMGASPSEPSPHQSPPVLPVVWGEHTSSVAAAPGKSSSAGAPVRCQVRGTMW